MTSKYNEGQFYEPVLTCLDYLELCNKGWLPGLDEDIRSGQLRETYQYKCVRFDLNTSHGLSRMFKVFDVVLQQYGNVGELIIRNHREKHFIVASWVFYQQCLQEVLQDFYLNINLTVSHITRMDIAIDTLNIIPHLNHLIYDRRFRFKGKIEPRGSVNSKTLQFNEEKEVTLGSRNSPAFVTIYPKGKKQSIVNKPHIIDYWTSNNLVPIDKIDRFELRLRTKATKRCDIDIFRLHEASYLLVIAQKLGKNFLVLIDPNDVQTNISRKKVIPLIDIPEENLPIIKKVERKKYTATNTFSDRITLKTLYRNLVLTGSITFQQSIEEILELNSCYDKWFESKVDTWEKEFRRDST